MSQLELLKTHIEQMNTRIKNIESEIEQKRINIEKLNNQKNEIESVLAIEDLSYKKLIGTFDYLLDVKTSTTTNFNQLEEAATTLLEILKNKCDDV
jgi:hypothetical protein